MTDLHVKDLGLVHYSDAYKIQNEIFNTSLDKKKNKEEVFGTILICEHHHVYTIGKSGNKKNLLVNEQKLKDIKAEYFHVDRGGDVTYHGPGQIIVYPIIDLDKYKLGVKDYIYLLEFMIIDILNDYGIKGEISKGNIGVWIDVGKPNERKICSAGVKISRGITMHGLALNVNTDLSYFDYINPCGFTEKGITSLKHELSCEINIDDLKKMITNELQVRLRDVSKKA